MPPHLLLLKEAWERRALILAIAVVGLLALAKRQNETIAVLRASKPAVEFRDRVVEKRVVVRGAVRVVQVKAPDGTVTTTTDRAPETVTTDKDREKERTETPTQLSGVKRTRYAGVGIDPARSRYLRARAGLNFLNTWDVGVAADFDVQQRAVTRPIIELTYRF